MSTELLRWVGRGKDKPEESLGDSRGGKQARLSLVTPCNSPRSTNCYLATLVAIYLNKCTWEQLDQDRASQKLDTVFGHPLSTEICCCLKHHLWWGQTLKHYL